MNLKHFYSYEQKKENKEIFYLQPSLDHSEGQELQGKSGCFVGTLSSTSWTPVASFCFE